MPIIGSIIRAIDRSDKNEREELAKLEEKTKAFASEHFKGQQAVRRARAIELAVNSLTAEGFKQVGDSLARFVPSEPELSAWAQRWKPELTS